MSPVIVSMQFTMLTDACAVAVVENEAARRMAGADAPVKADPAAKEWGVAAEAVVSPKKLFWIVPPIDAIVGTVVQNP